MGKSSPKPPPPPDPKDYRQAQITPQGSLTFGQLVPLGGPGAPPSPAPAAPAGPQRYLDAGGIWREGVDPTGLFRDLTPGGISAANAAAAPAVPGPVTAIPGLPGFGFQLDPRGAEATAFVSESPTQMALREMAEATGISLGGTAFNRARALGNLPALTTAGLPTVPTDLDALRGRTEQAFFERQKSLLDPEFSRRENTLRQTLANQGLPIAGDTAGGNEFRLFEDARNRAYQDAAREAVLAGGAEADRALSQALTTRGALLGERTGLRQQEFNELVSLLTGQQQTGGFNPPGGFNLGDPGAAAAARERANLAAFNAKQQANQGLMSGLFGLGGALGAAAILSPAAPAAAPSFSAGFLNGICWVAREVYGADNPRWLRFREWLVIHSPDWFLRLYLRRGQDWARWLKNKPRTKRALRWVMDRCIGD